jgi:hypothetical protein
VRSETADERWTTARERLVIVQYAGDYREAYERLSGGGPENYHAQRYSVDAVQAWGRERPAATVCCLTNGAYDEVLPNGVRAIGANLVAPPSPRAVVRILEDLDPTRLVVRTPITEVLSWACERRVPTILTLAESLPARQHRPGLPQLINDPTVEWVGCYQQNSVPAYVKAGIDPSKLVAWRWPSEVEPDDLAPKRFESVHAPPRLLFVGAVTEEKGVGDALLAVARLRDEHDSAVKLQVAGEGEVERFRAMAARLGVEDCVAFEGGVPASAVVGMMRASDVVLVPSRASFPEGLPLVLEHSLCARTPAVVSAHPAFAGWFEHQTDSMLFPPGDAAALAGCVRELLADRVLYERISSTAPATWERLQAPLLWDELIGAWLDATPESLGRIRATAAEL